MTRRLLAVVAIVALSIAYLSAEAVGLAAETPECCTAGMCPMHRMAAQGPDCDMDMTHPGSKLQPCPVQGPQYVTALVFLRVAPPALAVGEQPLERVPLFASPVATEIALDVAAPPPRNTLA